MITHIDIGRDPAATRLRYRECPQGALPGRGADPAPKLAGRRHRALEESPVNRRQLWLRLAAAGLLAVLCAVQLRPASAQQPPADAKVCPQLAGWQLVPQAVIDDALANPGNYGGWMQPANPALAPGPFNPLRTYLSLMTVAKPFHPIFNSVVWKPGCP
jgi:hypothetical protein